MLAALLAAGASACEVSGQIGAADVMPASTSDDSSTGIDDVPERMTSSIGEIDLHDDTSSSSEGDDTDAPKLRFDLGEPMDWGGGSSGGDVEDDTSAGTTGATCCEESLVPGCGEPELEQCVCEADAYCCDERWDATCVDIAMFGPCSGGCLPPEPPPPDDCCLANGGPGCVDPDVESCVCAVDPYCCSYTWDDVCVDYVDSLDCASCE